MSPDKEDVREPTLAEAPVVYTPEEAAAIMHTSARWIRDKVRAGQFPHMRVGKNRIVITAAQLEEIIALCTRAPSPPAPERRIGTLADRRRARGENL